MKTKTTKLVTRPLNLSLPTLSIIVFFAFTSGIALSRILNHDSLSLSTTAVLPTVSDTDNISTINTEMSDATTLSRSQFDSSFVSSQSQSISSSEIVFKPENLFHAWKTDRETCPQWISAQRFTKSYLDSYIIGVQKGATSEICMRLGKLGVMSPRADVKEWHFFEELPDVGDVQRKTHLHLPYKNADLNTLRVQHYLTGFPSDKDINSDTIPLVDDSPIENRTIVHDATVEYMLSDRAAFLAHLITPHAKVIMTMRDPLERALSQYNMMIRLYNKAFRDRGEKEIPATAEQFHAITKKEIGRITSCGYNARTTELDRSTSAMLNCVYDGKRPKFDDLLYVTRGLYHIHINTWRNYFPDHRMQFVSFSDISKGKRQVMNDLSDFLCVRRFPEEILREYENKGSDRSFGQQAADQGLSKMGFESYAGKDRYLTNVLPETKTMFEEFFGPANKKLEAMMGRKMF